MTMGTGSKSANRRQQNQKKSGMEAGPPFHIPRTTRPVELYSLTDPTD